MSVDAYYKVSGLSPLDLAHDLIGQLFPPVPIFSLSCDWTEPPHTCSVAWLDCDLARRLVSSTQSDCDLTGRLVCAVVYSFLGVLIPGRAAVNGASVGGLLLLCTLQWERAFLGMALSERNDSSTCFWGQIYLWITSLCKYFACSKLHPQTLDYHCCCVTLAASFLYFFSALLCSSFFLPLYLSRHQFNVSISFIPLSLSPRLPLPLSLATQSFFLSVCLFHFFFASPSLMMLSLAFEAASFVPDSHSSDWDILGFKVTQTDLLS